MNDPYLRKDAIDYFEKAHRQAVRERLAARVSGRDDHLLPFESIRRLLFQQNTCFAGVQNIPVEKITGTVGRYNDLNRHFLPVNKELRDRWLNITELGLTRGWPPIDVYKIGDVYFVEDGNHRVSAARTLGYETIEASVIEFVDQVDLQPEDSLDDALIKLGKHQFMEHTQLDQRFPDHHIHFTKPGGYEELMAQIVDLREKLIVIDEEEVSYGEAVAAWYELVYQPTVQIINDSTLLEDFPGRTEADLFVWISKMRQPLVDYCGEFENLSNLAELLTTRYKEGNLQRLSRQARGLIGKQELPPLTDEV